VRHRVAASANPFGADGPRFIAWLVSRGYLVSIGIIVELAPVSADCFFAELPRRRASGEGCYQYIQMAEVILMRDDRAAQSLPPGDYIQ